jgi:hypothetical protein
MKLALIAILTLFCVGCAWQSPVEIDVKVEVGNK